MTASASDQPASSSPARDVAVIGLGQMGRGIARNLDRAGRLAAAHDVTPDAFGTAGFSTNVRNLTPAEIGKTCAFVFLVVPASPEIEDCFEAGLIGPPCDGQVLLDMTTSYPSDTKRLADRASGARRDYIDCGMTGGAAGADAGTLTLMVGADSAAFARALPAMEKIAAKIIHVGPPGAGHTMKLIHNMILHTNFLATSEGCRLAERAGLDLNTVIEVLNNGNARSFVSEVRFPKHILTGKFDGRSRVSNLAKDLGMAARFASEMEIPAIYGPLTASLLKRAADSGMADEDFTRLYPAMDRLLAEHKAEKGEA